MPNLKSTSTHRFKSEYLPSTSGHYYLLTAIGRSTRWPEAIPMVTTMSSSRTSSIVCGWIARFGISEDITSDKGSTFTSQLWTLLANLLGITLHQTTTYNPAANGMVDCFHCTIKAALMFRCKNSDWFTQIPWVLLGLRATPKDTLDISSAEMVYGDPLVIPAECFLSATSSDNLQCLHHAVGKFTPCHQTYQPQAKHHIPTDLHSATHVFLRKDSSSHS
ncbi:uncharacterized protein [Palaemon carinicauda]|uniref:uncharacterized protein n=1 Tax=Palaemon carinicauda TaxID=392227 RepID=UPI0035B6113F